MSTFEHWERMLKAWEARCGRNLAAHYESARRLVLRHRMVGGGLLVAAVLSAAAGPLSDEPTNPLWLHVVMMTLGPLTAALAAIHVFLHDNDRALQHRAAAARYSAHKREIEVLIARLRQTGKVPEDEIGRIQHLLDRVGQESIAISGRVWRWSATAIAQAGAIPVDRAR